MGFLDRLFGNKPKATTLPPPAKAIPPAGETCLLEGLASAAKGDKPQALRYLSKAYSLGLMAQPDLAERAEKEITKLGVEAELCGTISFTVGASDGREVIDGVQAYYNFDYDRAIECLDRAVAADPQSRNALRYRAYILTAVRRWQDAVRDLTTLIGIEPSAFNYYDRAKAYFGNEQYLGAIEDSTKVIELPGTPAQLRSWAYFNRGSAHLRMSAGSPAVGDFTEALKLSGPDPAALYYRGKAYAALGRVDEARRDFSQALRHATQAVMRAQAQKALASL